MPRTRSTRDEDLPSTLKRSPVAARRTYQEAHDGAVRTYGEGERAHRTAFAALKRSYEKVGDHWEPKQHKGPSDERAQGRTKNGRPPQGKSAEGVDANASRKHLMEVARRLDISGRSRMRKDELVKAIVQANRSATRRTRSR